MRFAFAGLLVLGAVACPCMARVGVGQRGPTREAVVPIYVDENQTDPAPLSLRGLEGKVIGLGGDAIPKATVSLFTEDGHTLVGSETTGTDGKFKFEKVEHGLYRVVARVAGLCPANIPVKIEGSLLAHRRLEITMRPKDIDTCSYGMAK